VTRTLPGPALFAGIGWDDRGFELALLDERGTPVGTPRRFPAGQVAALIAHLQALDLSSGRPLVCVIDSTNGMLDGGLMAAGLRVHRADPWVLPQRPSFGSVDAESLARSACTRLSELPRLVIESGTLTGRGDDHAQCLRESEAGTAELTASGRCVERVEDAGENVIALTFDDGPNPPYTGRILDVLERYGVPATFFCVGLHASAHTEELSRMTEAGHRLANHTWSHPFLPDLSVAEFAAQLERTDEAVARVAGEQGARLFRPPYGSRSPEILAWLAEQDAGTTVLWDVDAGDWAMPGADAIARTVLDQAASGSIALLHDGGGDRSQTAEALPAIIEGLLDRGYRFARVDEMIGGRPQ
jgi:peptidoglycan/xylan/chitin deacetylase (PgdA/CDA1 family)